MTNAQTELLEAARRAAARAYAPYSGFRVGAAVSARGRIFTGANVENASYPLTMCAEQAALAAAVTAGERAIDGVAVYCLDAATDRSGSIPAHAAAPCGACRQWLAELAPDAWVVTNGRPTPYKVAELLPDAFSPPGSPTNSS